MALNLDLLDLPEIPSTEILRALSHAAICFRGIGVGAIGKQLQRAAPGRISHPSEQEHAAGLWRAIRGGIVAAKSAALAPPPPAG